MLVVYNISVWGYIYGGYDIYIIKGVCSNVQTEIKLLISCG